MCVAGSARQGTGNEPDRARPEANSDDGRVRFRAAINFGHVRVAIVAGPININEEGRMTGNIQIFRPLSKTKFYNT